MSTEQLTDPLALLQVPAACKICRGAGLDLEFTDSSPYYSHVRTEHPETLPPASAPEPTA